ncbi:IF-2B-domain-containing protein [Stereum hirsutum FP-91666 SS1]|uniref:IF-2B-domain-containing protein n=1 Tax=Stereum hirsutum (strain FP-91666) TaxID=721885 RepID=UPI000440F3EA|nr:IF-2B-domain-containing protein [Stereum hirsutum FP-91666 SS1]EIM88174.1 IF-2B-domain-containing protein [Stereum hirsutum FP-91666 SS1]
MSKPISQHNLSHPPPANKSQKQMTKAERREMQEAQRAAKAAKTAAGGGSQQGGGGKTTGVKQAQQQLSNSSTAQQKKGGRGEGVGSTKGGVVVTAATTGKIGKGESSKAAAAGSEIAIGRSRGLRIFSHFALQKTQSHVPKGDIHPAIARLGLKFAEFKICGANARCIATLSAFKEVVQDYVTPQNNTLSRHLMTHLSAQISHLVSARPMSVTMGNAIRQLKLEISGSDIDLPEQDAKDEICLWIDNYIRDRIIIADQVIQETAVKKIHNGDVILTYARSSVVEKVLLEAWSEGTQFSVVVVDSRPMLEGKRLLSVLASAGLPCSYVLLPSLGSIITEVSTVFVGAHSINSNGAVYSRAGTALVAMMAKQHSVPVVVCCETYKFSEGVQLDSFTKNELAPVSDIFSSFPLNKSPEALVLHNRPNLEILNPLYDLTPPSSITAVVTEVGVIPPDSISSIPLALGRQSI